MVRLLTQYPANQGIIQHERSRVSAAGVMQALSDYMETGVEDPSAVIPNLPLGVPIDLMVIGLFYTILNLHDDNVWVMKVKHALVHRMFRYNQTDLWWLVQSKPPTGYEHAVLHDIEKRWRDQAFILRMGRYRVICLLAHGNERTDR